MFGARYVEGSGPLNANIVIVGEAPGANEDKEGVPFAGAAGRELRELLSIVGIDFYECYVTNVSKWRPPNNDFSILYEDSKGYKPTPELRRMWTELQAEVERVSPNVIIALGNEPMMALMGRKGIGSMRGYTQLTQTGRKLIATYHPASIFKNYENRPLVLVDLKKAQGHSLSPDYHKPVERFTIFPSFAQTISWLSNARMAGANLAIDIETVGRRVRCIGIARNEEEAICIPFITGSGNQLSPNDKTLFSTIGQSDQSGRNYWTEDEEIKVLEQLNALFLSTRNKKYFQNYPFDGPILLREFGLHIRGFHFDTLIGLHTLYPEMPKSLEFLTSIYTDRPAYKSHDSKSDHSEFVYNCRDCVATWEIAQKMMAEIREVGMWEYYRFVKHPVMVALSRMSQAGVPIDNDQRMMVRQETIREHAEVMIELEDLTWPGFKPASPKQKKDFLYGKDYLNLPMQFNRKTGQPTTDAKALNKLLKTYSRAKPQLELLLRESKLRTLINNFLSKPLSEDEHGNPVMLTSFVAHGTKNHRISSKANAFDEGGNLQNIPRSSFRRMFQAPENYSWIKADYSQAEARCVAWEAGIDFLINAWSTDIHWDIHRWNAAENIYHVPESEVTKAQRDHSKAGVHGGNYGLGAETASELFGIEIREARLAISAYRKRFTPEIPNWWNSIEEQLNKNRTLVNPFGSRRVFFDRLDDHKTIRSGYSYGPQSTVGDLINTRLVVFWQILPTYGWRPVLQVHDEIDFIGPTEHLREVVKIIYRVLEVPIYYPNVDQPLIIPAEVEAGTNWWDVKEMTREGDYAV